MSKFFLLRIVALFGMLECLSFASLALQNTTQFLFTAQWGPGLICLLLYVVGMIGSWKIIKELQEKGIIPDKRIFLPILAAINLILFVFVLLSGDTTEALCSLIDVIDVLLLLLLDRMD